MTTARPNIVFITSHDTGDWLHCYGHDTVNTPNLDALAANGCLVRSSFCTSPVCTPSRGALMTGRYPQSNGLMGLIQTPFRWRLHDGEQHLSHLLRDAGYRTILFNHQHEAEADDPLGFTEMRAHDVGQEKLLTGERVSTAAETAAAFDDFLQERRDGDHEDSPFYAQIGFFETHTPFNWNDASPDRSIGLEIPPYVVSDEQSEAYVAALQGSIACLDTAVGTIVDSLRNKGILNNTLIVFTVDHGVELPRCKWELYDGGIRTALLMHWPAGIVCNQLEALVSNVDVVPTLLELINVPVPNNIQGKSFAGELTEDRKDPHRDAVFAMMLGSDRWTESRSVRTERYKLIRNFSPSRMQQPPIRIKGGNKQQERPVVELYDLEVDPHELNNIAEGAEVQEIMASLDQKLRAWMEEVKDPILKGPVPTPYYRMAMSDFDGNKRESN